VEEIAGYCQDIGVKVLTLYGFSTENWSRPKEEIAAIMRLFRAYLDRALRDRNQNVRTRFLGDISALDEELRKKMHEIERLSAGRTGMTLNFAINYGGREEILQAVRKLVEGVREGRLKIDQIDEASFSAALYTAGQPDPDLIIRPSGEQRLSNFLLWQCAYSEFVFMDVLWPDFTPACLDEAIAAYRQRSRRFGG
jgi:undecaprenyl diphosphate synthase